MDFLSATERAFAKLNPPKQCGFIPTRLRRNPVSAFSAESLACMFATEKPRSIPIEATVMGALVMRRRRLKHRKDEM
jgi:hypothetical protein